MARSRVRITGLQGKNLVLIYGPNDREGRGCLWNELLELKQEIDLPMMIFGDFNEVLNPEERRANSLISSAIREFQACQKAMNMIDLPLLGMKFTWYRSNSASRIDRVFVDAECFEIFKELKLWGLKRSVFDHCPLLVSSDKEEWGPKPFRSLDVVFTNSEFIKLVERE